MNDFKIRCSSISKIMGIKGLGKTGETYCKEWLIEQIFNRRNEFTSKYTQKGKENEDEGIDMIANYLGYPLLLKNDKKFENEFCKGEPDIIIDDLIIDVKNSWSCFTFPFFENEVPNDVYYWQLQGYMWLTGKSKAKLIYTLTDTPEHLILSEAKRYCYANGYDELDLEIYKQFHDKMTYPDIDDKFKIKSFDIERNESDIKKIEQRVIECRKVINELFYNENEIKL